MTQPSSGLIPLLGDTESEVFTGHAIFRDNPFDGLAGNYKILEFIEGSTAEQIVNLACVDNSWLKNYIQVKIGNEVIPREAWHLVKLKRTAPIQLLVVAQGGGGGDILKTVAMVAIVVAVTVATSGAGFAAAMGSIGITSATGVAIAGALTVMAVSMVAGLALNAIFPPPSIDQPSLGSSSGGTTEADRFGWNSDSNTSNKYRPVPRIYGRVRVAPPYAANPFVEALGDKQYLYMLFDFGYGPLQLDDLMVGENPIDTFQGIQYRIHPSFKKGDQLSFYNRDVYQDSYSLKLANGSWRQATGTSASSEFIVDFSFPQGLALINSTNGNTESNTVDLGVVWRKVGDTAWKSFYDTSHTVNGGFVVDAQESRPAYWISTSPEYSLKTRPADYQIFDELPNVVNYPDGRNITLRTFVQKYDSLKATYYYESMFVNYQKSAATITTGHSIRVTNATQKPFTVSLTMRFAAGDYEFAATRYSIDSNDRYNIDDVYLASIRSVKNVAPIAPEAPHTIVEIKVLANDQLNGVFTNFTAVATSILPVWDGTKFTNQATRNPAWAYLDVLRGTASVYPASLDRIDLNSFLDWARWCDKPALNAPSKPKSQCDIVISGEYTAWQVLKMISATGDGTPSVRSGKYSISIDRPRDYPVQLFTPRNSNNFSSNLTYTKIPHALRVSFIDPDQNWQPREALVYDDGYSAANATEFQTMDLVGITTYEQAYRIGRRSIAQATLRRETFQITTGVENILATRGDMVRLSYDIPKIGVGWARITKIAGNIITFDDDMALAKANDYLRVRTSNDFQVDLLVLNPVDIRTLAVSGDIAKLRVGQLAVYGSRQTITMDCLVKSISPSADLSATIELVAYAPEIYSAEGKPIPDYNPLISNINDRRVGPVVNLKAAEIDTVINRYHYISIALSWLPPVGIMPKGYEIYELQEGQWVQIGTTKELSFYAYKEVEAVKADGSPVDLLFRKHTFAVVGAGGNGVRIQPNDAPQTTITPVGDPVRPQAPEFFELDIRSKETIYLEWSRSISNDVDHYIVRYSPLFQGANFDTATIVAARIPWSSNTITVPARLGTYFIKTVDTFGNVSSVAARAVTPTATLNDDIDLIRLEESSWGGELINMVHHTSTSIESSSSPFTTTDPIYPTPTGNFPFFRADNNYDLIAYDENGDLPFYEEDGEYDPIVLDDENGLPFIKYGVDYAQGGAYIYQSVINMGEIYPISFSAHIEAFAIKDGSPLILEDVSNQWDSWFEIRTSDTIPYVEEWPALEGVEPTLLYGARGWTPWRKFYAGEYTGQYFQFRLCVATNDKELGVRVTRAYVDVSAKVRIEGEYDIQCPATGVDVLFDPPYKQQPSIGITQDNAKEGDRFAITNKSRLGFSIQFFDKANNPVARQFDWISKGHGKEVFEIPPYDQTPSPKGGAFSGGESSYMSSIKNQIVIRGQA